MLSASQLKFQKLKWTNQIAPLLVQYSLSIGPGAVPNDPARSFLKIFRLLYIWLTFLKEHSFTYTFPFHLLPKQIRCEYMPCGLLNRITRLKFAIFSWSVIRGIFSKHFQSCIKLAARDRNRKISELLFFLCVLTERSEVHTVKTSIFSQYRHPCLVNKICLFSKYFITISNQTKTRSTRLWQVIKI